jgi:hypothetical protein
MSCQVVAVLVLLCVTVELSLIVRVEWPATIILLLVPEASDTVSLTVAVLLCRASAIAASTPGCLWCACVEVPPDTTASSAWVNSIGSRELYSVIWTLHCFWMGNDLSTLTAAAVAGRAYRRKKFVSRNACIIDFDGQPKKVKQYFSTLMRTSR